MLTTLTPSEAHFVLVGAEFGLALGVSCGIVHPLAYRFFDWLFSFFNTPERA
jgi:hypothetical protein